MSESAPQRNRLPEGPGAAPFVFICYSHKDADRVVPHIDYLKARGIEVWFDDGIRAGTIWRQEIDDALGRATHVVFFVSRASLDSDHCQSEVHYGLENRKAVVPVYLEDVELTSGLRVALTRLQALYAHRLSDDVLHDRLRRAIQDTTNAHVAAPRPSMPVGTPIERMRSLVWITLVLVVVGAGVWWTAGRLGWRIEVPSNSAGIVVLPFDNGSGRAEDAYLSEGFADELRDQLSRVAGLRVVARPSSIVYRGQTKPASAIASELGVSTVVEGSLRKEGERVRISVRLIDGANDAQLWSESYDRKAIDMLAVEQEIAVAAAQQISPKVSTTQLTKPQWQASVNDLMLLARSYQQNAVTPADWDKVVSMYQQVVQNDPESAPAHARLAKSLLFQGKDLESAEAHARRAIEIDPNFAEGHAVLGFFLWTQFRRGAGQEYERALELNPNDVETLRNYGEYLVLRRRDPSDGQRAADYMRRARDLDPMSLQNSWTVAYFEAIAKAPEFARDFALIEERFPDSAGRFALARISEAAGDLDEAIAWALEARRLDPGNAEVSRDIAEWLARLGLDAASRKVEPEPSLRTLFWERRYDDIIARMASADLDQADGDALGTLGFALQAMGRDSEAVPALEAIGLPQRALDDDLRRPAAIHYLAILIGSLQVVDKPQAKKLALWLEQFVEAGGEGVGGKDEGFGQWWAACTFSVLGKRAEALTKVETTSTIVGLAWLPYLRDAACFRDLQKEPRYQAAIRTLQARHDAIRDRLPATLAKHGFTMEQI